MRASWKFYYSVNKAEAYCSSAQHSGLLKAWHQQNSTWEHLVPPTHAIVLCIYQKSTESYAWAYMVLIPQNCNLNQCFPNTRLGISSGPWLSETCKDRAMSFLWCYFFPKLKKLPLYKDGIPPTIWCKPFFYKIIIIIDGSLFKICLYLAA